MSEGFEKAPKPIEPEAGSGKLKTTQSPEQELSPEAIQEVMEKVEDFSDLEIRNLVLCHAVGTEGGGPSSVAGGLFSTEKILTLGILPSKLADRLSIERSSFGYDTAKEHVGQFRKYKESVFVSPLSRLTQAYTNSGPGKIESILPKRGWFFLINGRYSGEHHRGRVAPKRIMGLVVGSEYFNKDIEQFLLDAEHKFYQKQFYKEFKQSIQDLGLKILPQEEVLFSKHEKTISDIEQKSLEAQQELKNEAAISGRKPAQQEYYDISMPADKEISKNYLDMIKILLSIIKRDEKYNNINTFGDYLKKISVEYKVPIYNENGDLVFPNQMSFEEVKKFVAEREQKKGNPAKKTLGEVE